MKEEDVICSCCVMREEDKIYGPVDKNGCVNVSESLTYILDQKLYNKSYVRRLAKGFKIKPRDVYKAWKEGVMHNTMVEHEIQFHLPEWGKCGGCLREEAEDKKRWEEFQATWKCNNG